MADDDDLGFGFDGLDSGDGFGDGGDGFGDAAPAATSSFSSSSAAAAPAPPPADDFVDEFEGLDLDSSGFGFEATPASPVNDGPQPEKIDYNAPDYFDPNMPPEAPPAPQLPEEGTIDQKAVTEDSLYVAWPAQNFGLKSLVLQGRRCTVKNDDVKPCEWDSFDAFRNKDDVQIVIRENIKTNTGGRVYGLQPNTPYMFRLVSTNRVGKVIGEVSEPIWTCEPERGSMSGWLSLDKGTGSGTLRKMSFRKKRVLEKVWVVLLGESLHIMDQVDGKTKRTIPMKKVRSIDSTETAEQRARHFRVLTTENESIVFFARSEELSTKWVQTLRHTLKTGEVEFGGAAKTNLMF